MFGFVSSIGDDKSCWMTQEKVADEAADKRYTSSGIVNRQTLVVPIAAATARLTCIAWCYHSCRATAVVCHQLSASIESKSNSPATDAHFPNFPSSSFLCLCSSPVAATPFRAKLSVQVTGTDVFVWCIRDEVTRSHGPHTVPWSPWPVSLLT